MLTRAIKQTNNPQDWLPIGQRVLAPSEPERMKRSFYLPVIYTSEFPRYVVSGIVCEHLTNGGVAIKWDGYTPTVDYSPAEACRFTRCY